jgi:hypothetical protein
MVQRSFAVLALIAVVQAVGQSRGCFVDTSTRILPHVVTTKWANMTKEICGAACSQAGFQLAGVEAAYGCFCGNALASSAVRARESECCSPCVGNVQETCGSKWRIFVYPANQPGYGPSSCTWKEADPRDIYNGTVMLHDSYLDQPYCDIIPSTGRWVCTVTDNSKPEGSMGEHVACIWSDDEGRTWSKPVSVEPAPNNTLLANAYSMTIVAPGMGRTSTGAPTERVYAIYNMNTQNITHDGSTGPRISRTDMLGRFWMRYSDDSGETWSQERYLVPYRLTSIDKNNEFGGNVTIMWTVDQLKVRGGVAYFAFTKIGKYLLGPPEELWVMASPNLLSESDASKVLPPPSPLHPPTPPHPPPPSCSFTPHLLSPPFEGDVAVAARR